MQSNNFLVLVDLSAWLYMVIFHSVNEWSKKSKAEFSSMVHDPEETDQDNLPNLLVSDSFKRILKSSVTKKLSTLDWLLKKNYQDKLDVVDNVLFLLVSDDYTKNSFRKVLYPEYKGERALVKKAYDYHAIRKYILDIVFPDLNLTENNYIQVACQGAEADDIIATISKSEIFRQYYKIVVSSDHDFCQLHDEPNFIGQINLFGDPVEDWLDKEKTKHLTARESLIVKIIVGDKSDSIPQIWDGVGPKKALALARNREALTKKLCESKAAAEQFILNKKLIDMGSIPHELTKKIEDEVQKKIADIFDSSSQNERLDMVEFDLMSL